MSQNNEIEQIVEVVEVVKRGRGRPKKNITITVDDVKEVAEITDQNENTKRGYRSKYFYMTEEETKARRAQLKRENNIKYKEKHYNKIREAQTRYFAKDSTKEKMKGYYQKNKTKKENEAQNEILDV